MPCRRLGAVTVLYSFDLSSKQTLETAYSLLRSVARFVELWCRDGVNSLSMGPQMSISRLFISTQVRNHEFPIFLKIHFYVASPDYVWSSILKNPNPLIFNITFPAREPPKVDDEDAGSVFELNNYQSARNDAGIAPFSCRKFARDLAIICNLLGNLPYLPSPKKSLVIYIILYLPWSFIRNPSL